MQIDKSLALSPEDFVATQTIMRINQYKEGCGTTVAQQLVQNFKEKKGRGKKKKKRKKKGGQTKIGNCSVPDSGTFSSRVQLISSQCGHLKEAK